MSTLSLQNWKVWWLTQSFNIANSLDQRVCSKLQRKGNRDVFYFKIPHVMHLWKTSQPVHFTRSAENFEFENIVLISRCEIQKGKNKTPKYNVDARCHPHGWEGGSTIIWTLILEHLYFVNLLLWFSNSARVWPFPRWVGRQEGASSCFKLQNQTSASF